MIPASMSHYSRDLTNEIPPVHPNDLARSHAAINLHRLNQPQEIADMLGLGDLYKAFDEGNRS